MGLTTFFQDADKGKAKFEELRKLSNETTFGVDELTDSFTQLANVGVKVDTITGKLTMLGDLAQGDKAKFAELTSIYAKIQSTGKAGALQLQQIASRGIPIYDILKKIGVQGTATGADITKAFEEMTKEGGQFYNAMNNINDTIEGKRGFISDYLKEMSVNFVELTGLADAYKAVLDNLKDVIGAVSDKLLEWNENPVMKALISGLFVASITAIGGVIASAIIPKLITVIGHLVTINLLSGAKGWAVLAVAGITGVGVAMASLTKSSQDEVAEMEKLTEQAEKLKNATSDSQKRSVGLTPESDTRKTRLQNESSYLAGLREGAEEIRKKLEEANTLKTELIKFANGDMNYLEKYDSDWAEVNQQIKEYNTDLERANKLIADQEKVVGELQTKVNNVNQLGELSQQFEEIYNGTLTKEVKEMTDLTSQLQQVREYEAKLKELKAWEDNDGQLIKYDDKTKEQINQTVNYLQKKLDDVQLKLKLANMEEWQKKLQNAFGFTNKEVMGGAVNSTVGALAKFQEIWKSQGALYSKYGIQGSKYDSKEEYAKAIRSAFDAVLESVREGTYSGDEASLVSFANAVKEAENAVNGLTDKVEVSISSLSDLSTHLMNIATGKDANGNFINEKGDRIGAMAGAMAINGAQGSNAGDIANGAMQGASVGGPIGALIGALVALAMKTQTVTDALEDLNGIIDPLIKAVNAILKPITSLAKVIINVLSPILEALATVLENVFDFFFGWLNDYADSTREATKAKEDELAQMKSLTQSYQDLLKAVREQEEYYIRKKAELNMYALNDKVSNVNDMILTDKGVFSTSPQDTIIAMKHPENLGGGKVINNIKVINNAGVDVQTSQRKNGDGMNEMLITISRKIAGDVAGGYNGWDSAFAMQQQRINGRRI